MVRVTAQIKQLTKTVYFIKDTKENIQLLFIL